MIDAYFAALATKHYGQPYRLWGGGGQATGMSEAEFTAPSQPDMMIPTEPA